MQDLGITSQAEYRKVGIKVDSRFSLSPQSKYKDDWKGWGDLIPLDSRQKFKICDKNKKAKKVLLLKGSTLTSRLNKLCKRCVLNHTLSITKREIKIKNSPRVQQLSMKTFGQAGKAFLKPLYPQCQNSENVLITRGRIWRSSASNCLSCFLLHLRFRCVIVDIYSDKQNRLIN